MSYLNVNIFPNNNTGLWHCKCTDTWLEQKYSTQRLSRENIGVSWSPSAQPWCLLKFMVFYKWGNSIRGLSNDQELRQRALSAWFTVTGVCWQGQVPGGSTVCQRLPVLMLALLWFRGALRYNSRCTWENEDKHFPLQTCSHGPK